jgi:hypothetical protein
MYELNYGSVEVTTNTNICWWSRATVDKGPANIERMLCVQLLNEMRGSIERMLCVQLLNEMRGSINL